MTNFQSVAPYFDDFDETKKFLKILFRPGYAVQARELNQLQTILQNQISRVGSSLYKNGAMVVPGQISYDNNIGYVKLNDTNSSGQSISNFLNEFVGTTIVGQTSGVNAQVIAVSASTSTDPSTLYVKYTSNGTTTTVATFNDNEALVSNGSPVRNVTTINSGSTGLSSAASILPGIYFVNNEFVLVDAQTIILSKYNNTPSLSVGLTITETVVTPEQDSTLNDNANGSYNYTAPGAHRYVMTLTLDSRPLGSIINNDTYIQLLSVNAGILQSVVTTTDYSVLEQTLARRTYDEAGDFVVKNFNIQVKENYNNNRGAWKSTTPYNIGDVVTAGSHTYVVVVAGISGMTMPTTTSGAITDGTVTWNYTTNPSYNLGFETPDQGGDKTKLTVTLDPGKAYVRGFEITKVATTPLLVDKAQTYGNAPEAQVQPIVGNYIIINNTYSMIENMAACPTVNLYDTYITTNGSASGTLSGTAQVRGMDYNDSGSFKLFLFNVTMKAGYNFTDDVKSIYYANVTVPNFTCNIYPEYINLVGAITAAGTTVTGTGTRFLTDLDAGDYITDGTNVVKVVSIASNVSMVVTPSLTTTGASFAKIIVSLKETQNSALIFPIGYSTIRKLREIADESQVNASYSVYQDFGLHTTSGSGTFTLTLSVSGQTFSNVAGYGNYIVMNTTTGGYVTPTVSLNLAETTATFSGLSNSTQYKVLCVVNKATGAAKEKVKTLVTGATIDFTTLSAASSAILYLNKADGFRLDSVMMAPAFGAYSSTNAVDVTQNYTFNTGQTQDYYGLSYVTLNAGGQQPTGSLRITFEYFTHGTGDYFSVNSYTGAIDYTNINPILRDSLDFRPRMGDDGTFTALTASASGLPKRGLNFSSDLTYYLPRNDKIILDSAGNLSVVQGTPGLIPQDPVEPSNVMVLYKLEVPAYTISPNNVTITSINNRLYTMKDIGNIDQRLSNVEYYTSLSLLEQQTQSASIVDTTTGLQQYKNGFIVDAFSGHGIGDVTNPDYNCAIDTVNQQLRPFYSMDSINLVETATTDAARAANNYTMKGGRITLPFTEIEFINQPYASRTENVNPFAIFTFIGNTQLNPSTDDWFDTVYAPNIVNNDTSEYDAVVALANQAGILGTVWNAWQTIWTGVPQVTNNTTVFGVHTTDYATYTNGVLNGVYARSADQLNLWGGTAGMARTINSQVTATQVGQSRTGINTTIQSNVNTQVVGTNTLSTSAIPYIRSRFVLIAVRGLKPNTTFYPYFDSTNIQSYITPAAYAPITAVTGYDASFDYSSNVGGLANETRRQINGNTDSSLNKGDVVVGQTSGATAVVAYQDAGTNLYLVNIIGTFTTGEVIIGSLSAARATIGTVTIPATGAPIVSNSYGDVVGMFNIPNTAAVKFMCGTRTFKLTDSTTNGLDYTSMTSANYEAVGTLETKQNTILSTQTATIVQTAVSQNQTVTQTNQSVSDTGWWDPLAETFLVNQPGGCFLTGVDLFFATKDDNLPVTLEIWETNNGYPAQSILPFSTVMLNPNQVNISTDSTAVTHFEFSSPVYVSDQTEYCIVVKSDSNAYTVWISQLGELTADTNTVISSQPYAGVLFKSQNASTWTADQTQDLKFKIYRASFNTAVNGNVVLTNATLPLVNLPNNPFKTKAASTTIRVYHDNHGFVNGSTVTFSGVTGTVNGVAASALNASFVVANVDKHSYLITVSGISPTASGRSGGTGIMATSNVAANVVQTSTTTQNFNTTSIDFTVNIKTADLSSAISSSIIDGQNLILPVPCAVGSRDNTGPVGVTAVLQSTTETLSPVLDIDRLSLIAVANDINVPSISYANDVDYQFILTSSANLSLSGVTISTTDLTTKGILDNLVSGRYLRISGCTHAGNNAVVKIITVATDGSSITTDTSFTTESGGSISLELLDYYIEETSPVGGSALSKYITKSVNLANTSTYFKAVFSANIPQYANVLVYYRTSPIGATNTLAASNWILVSPDATIQTANDPTVFTDISYSQSDLAPFNAIEVKIVMESTNTSYVPLIEDLRITACA